MITIYRTIDDTYIASVEVSGEDLIVGDFKSKRKAEYVAKRMVKLYRKFIKYYFAHATLRVTN